MEGVEKLSGGFVGVVWSIWGKLSRGCWETDCIVLGRLSGWCWRLSEGCGEALWRMRGDCLEGVG